MDVRIRPSSPCDTHNKDWVSRFSGERSWPWHHGSNGNWCSRFHCRGETSDGNCCDLLLDDNSGKSRSLSGATDLGIAQSCFCPRRPRRAPTQDRDRTRIHAIRFWRFCPAPGGVHVGSAEACYGSLRGSFCTHRIQRIEPKSPWKLLTLLWQVFASVRQRTSSPGQLESTLVPGKGKPMFVWTSKSPAGCLPQPELEAS